ncbi:hypothetical protein BH10PSE12_BH10PSE12_32610 [soil metagenome]
MAHVKPVDADQDDAPAIAILPWGDVIEDFLDPLGLDARNYIDRASGGWLFGYVAALQEAGWRPVILWASRAVATPERIIHPATGVSVWLVPGQSRPIEHWNARTSLRRWWNAPMAALEQVIRAERCRVLLAQEYEDPRFDRLARLGRRLGLPVFASFQGGDRTASWLEEWVRSRSLAMSAGLIIASVTERTRVMRAYRHLPPITNIANPIDLEEWVPTPRLEARQRLGLDPDCFLVFNHGRIDIQRKGLDILVDAWATLDAGPKDRLVMMGSGQDDERFRALLADRAPAGIEWLSGYSTDRQLMRNWLCAADVYVTASRTEGMPVAPLEAMACGLPIIASDAQGLSDILEEGLAHGGLLIARNDARALTAAIAQLRADPALRAQLGMAARQRVEMAFSISVVSRALTKLLASAMRTPPHRIPN